MLTLLDKVVAVLLIGVLFWAAAMLRPADEHVTGSVRVIDGDTLEIAGRRIRLVGIDAPELDQTCERASGTYPCGEEARHALVEIARAGAVSCNVSGRDRYGRDLALCRVDDEDLGRALVLRGQAVSERGYASEERSARELRLGIWAGSFERPSSWRMAHRR